MNTNGQKLINYLNEEIESLFKAINDPRPDGPNITDIMASWVIYPDGSTSPFQKMNLNQITNANRPGTRAESLKNTFAKRFYQEMTSYIRLSALPENGNNSRKMIQRFNQFFRDGKIKIEREEIGFGDDSRSSGSFSRRLSFTPVSQPRSRAGSVTGINVRSTLAASDDQPFVIYYSPSPGEKITIPFEFQTIISTDKITDENDRKIILAFITILRKYYVDRLIQIITQKVFYHCDKKSGVNTKCSIVAVGSVSLTSNYDVTVSGVIYPNRIVRMFNQEFAKFWRDYSSNVFDTNLYGSTFFVTLDLNADIDPKYSQLYRILRTPTQQILYLPPEKILEEEYPMGMREIRVSQLKWLMIKIFLHQKVYTIPEEDPLFSICTVDIVDAIRKMISGGGGNSKNSLNAGLRKAVIDSVFDEKFGTPDSRMIVLESYDDKKKTLENYDQSLVQIQSSQLTYENLYISSIINKNKGSPSNPAEILRILMELIDNVSKSNFYGSETYFCMATIYHVLGYVQKLGPFVLSREDYLISAIENFIDIFRYYSKIRLEGGEHLYGIIKMSKYVYRVYNAIAILHSDLYTSKEKMWREIMTEMKGQHSFNGNVGSRHMRTLEGLYPVSGSDSIPLIQRILLGISNDLLQSISRSS